MSVALVTGTSTGIGQATAIALARKGHKVYAAMRNLAGAGELTKIATDEKLAVIPIQMDVDSDASVDLAIKGVLEAEGRIDVLVNNAGIGGGASVEETSLETFRAVMETNFFGVLRCAKAVVPSMRKQRGGCIVNISSVAGRIAMAPQGAYAASKWAVEAMSECLAQEMKAFNVRVALIEPGVIATAIFGKSAPPIADSPYPHTRRLTAVFAASLGNPASPFLVADQICEIVDGGSWRLRYPVGPDAEPYIAWRKSKSDEAFVALGGAGDAEFKAVVKADMGLDVIL
jgi:NAD(P)-dependent dehydrogenase (short-subunit alcohol dehydrogenase family)